MAKATKKCRVCGKEYEYCHTLVRVPGGFRWQDVACSPECGTAYLAQIEASRSVNTDTSYTSSENEESVGDAYVYDEEDEELDEDDEDIEDSDFEA